MKKIIFLLVACLLLAGCQGKKFKPYENPKYIDFNDVIEE